MNPKLYTTREAADRAGVSRQTLQTWIAQGKVKAPTILKSAGVRLWTEEDLVRLLKIEPRKYPRKAKRRH